MRRFKSLKTAYATIKGFEVMHALRKGQAALWQYGGGVAGEVRLLERQFGVYTAEASYPQASARLDQVFATEPFQRYALCFRPSECFNYI